MAELSNKVTKIIDDRIKQIPLMQDSLGKEVARLQRLLLRMIERVFLREFQIDEFGNLIYNTHNINLVNDLDKLMNRFNTLYQDSVIAGYSNDLLKVTDLSAQYFVSVTDLKTKVFDSLKKNQPLLGRQLGVKIQRGKSQLIRGGYLDRLAQNEEVRRELKNIAIGNISGKASFKDFANSIRETIVGREGVDGALTKYYKQYAYDGFSAVQAATDLYMADSLGLNYFIYSGSTIKTTRPFCIERVNQIFSREEAETWEALDWKGKNPNVSFFIARGGYNCRHQLDWITDKLAAELGAVISV